MQIKTVSFAVWMACAVSSSIAMAAEAPIPAQPLLPQTSEAWLQQMTDFSRNGMAFKDPRTFLAWSNAVTEPGFYPVLVQGMTDPAMSLAMTNSMVSPAAMRNMASFADPAIAARWMGAAVDPRFYAQMATQFANPGKMMRWVMLPMDPRMLQAAGQMVNPAQAMKWAMVPADPRLWSTAANAVNPAVNPAVYAGMAGAAMNPQSYGQTWGAVAQPMRAPVAVSMPMMPAGTLPQSQPQANVRTAVAAVAPAPLAAVVTPPVAPAKSSAPTASPSPAPLAPLVQSAPQTMVTAPAPLAPVAAAAVSVSGGNGKKILLTDMLFQVGKTDVTALTPDGKKALDAVAAQIKAASAVGQVVVMGHADPTGKAKGNQVLSQKRAKAVKAYLTAQGVKADLIVTSGLGATQPAVNCDPKAATADKMACNAPNRRIEVEIRKLPPK